MCVCVCVCVYIYKLTYMQCTCVKCQNESHTVIKIARRSINNLRYAHDTTVMAE